MNKNIIAATVGWLASVLGAAAQVGPNIDKLAKELSNPGAANATLNFKFEYSTFKGTLPRADDQDSLTATFQPMFPFVLGNGNNLIFRPAIPYVFGLQVAKNYPNWKLVGQAECQYRENVVTPDAFASD